MDRKMERNVKSLVEKIGTAINIDRAIARFIADALATRAYWLGSDNV